MKIHFANRGVVQIDDARIIYRNFAGAPSKFNREGDRNFAVVIEDQDIAEALTEKGWNVKIKPPREEGGLPFMVLKVKIKFNEFGPNVYLESGGNMRKLDEESISMLDKIRISSASLDISPYDSTVGGVKYRTPYLRNMKVVQFVEDRFAEEYDSYQY